MRTYKIKPDKPKNLSLLEETKLAYEVEEGVAKFTSGAAFITALTFLRRRGARCAVESVG